MGTVFLFPLRFFSVSPVPLPGAMPRCLIGLGANEDDPAGALSRARDALVALDPSSLVTSSLYETVPAGGPASRPFVNACITLQTTLQPADLMRTLLKLERDFGRQRAGQQTLNRPLDLDVLLVEDQIFAAPTVAVPHPRMSFRRFVLEPAAEIAGDWIHPIFGSTLADLLGFINRATGPIAVAAPMRSGLLSDTRTAATTGDLLRSLPDVVDELGPVVIQADQRQIDWIDTARLLVEWTVPVASAAELWQPAWRGPRWQIHPDAHSLAATEIRHVLRTAAESMLPVRSRSAWD